MAAVCVAPAMPGKAAELWAQLGGPGDVLDQRFAGRDALDPAGWRVRKGAAPFPRDAAAAPAA